MARGGRPDRSGRVRLSWHPRVEAPGVLRRRADQRSQGPIFAVDRPGYGHSTFQQGRRLADWALDVSSLADHLHIDKFSVIGISGGGPHAAVCARFLPDRVIGAGIVSGVAPLTETGSEEGMMGLNKAIVRLARRSRYLVYPPFAISGYVARRWPEIALRAAPRQLPACDVEVLKRPKVKSAFMEDYRRSSPTSAMAAAQDFSLIASDWGFRLQDITRPVNVWHGDEDRNVRCPTDGCRRIVSRGLGCTNARGRVICWWLITSRRSSGP